MDTYAMSKVCIEAMARSFSRRFGIDVYVLRIGAVITPDEYESCFHEYIASHTQWKCHGWSYVDARDLGQKCHRAIEVDGLGFQVFNATNDEITGNVPTEEFLKVTCPKTPFTRSMGKMEAPMSNRKIKTLLGFTERHHWRKYFTYPTKTKL